ncbi:hypothetical protein K320107C7_27990 [Alistipes shahii]|uniref:terminase large subunit domain-containing protein n=1 Tax=Alistipes shahii TaxID=328814 RepID=UPI0036F1B9C7
MAAVKKYPAELYAEQVRSGEILVCEYVRLAVERYYADLDRALDMGRYFDKKAAMRAIHFIEKLKHTKGEWAGQRFRLEPWQQFVLWNIFGWKNADGTRRFRYAYIEIARKNGKTDCLPASGCICSSPTARAARRFTRPRRSRIRRKSVFRMLRRSSRRPT